MDFIEIKSEIEEVIFKKQNEKYDKKWWYWQLNSNGFKQDEQYRFIHKQLPNVTITIFSTEVWINLWHNHPYGVNLFNCKMSNSKKAVEYIQNKLNYDNYKKWLEK